MVATAIIILIIFWLLGLFAHIGGGLINLLLIVALVVFILNILNNRDVK